MSARSTSSFLIDLHFKQKLAQELVMGFVEYIPIKTAKSLSKKKKSNKKTNLKSSFMWETETKGTQKNTRIGGDENCYIISFKQTLNS